MNRIHPMAIVDESVVLGTGNTIGPNAVISGNVRIGDNNWIGPHAVIGTPGQVRGNPHPTPWCGDVTSGGVVIGSDNIIREFATIHSSLGGLTAVGSNCYLMAQAHVPHDATVENDVTLCNSVHLGGHTIVQRGANIGFGTAVHQYTVIGAGVMIGMNTVVKGNVPPFALFFGNPGRIRDANVVGLRRMGYKDETISRISNIHKLGALDQLLEIFPKEMGMYLDAVATMQGRVNARQVI